MQKQRIQPTRECEYDCTVWGRASRDTPRIRRHTSFNVGAEVTADWESETGLTVSGSGCSSLIVDFMDPSSSFNRFWRGPEGDPGSRLLALRLRVFSELSTSIGRSPSAFRVFLAPLTLLGEVRSFAPPVVIPTVAGSSSTPSTVGGSVISKDMSPAAGWLEADGVAGREPCLSFTTMTVSSAEGEAAESFLACALRARAGPLAVRSVSAAGGAVFVVSVGGVRRFFVAGVSSSYIFVQLNILLIEQDRERERKRGRVTSKARLTGGDPGSGSSSSRWRLRLCEPVVGDDNVRLSA